MSDCVLYWALPDSWTQFELLADDLENQIDREMRSRFVDTSMEADLARVIALQAATFRELAADGLVLVATYAAEAKGSGSTPPGLSLTLALANRPASGTPAHDAVDKTESQRTQSASLSPSPSAPQPFLLEDPGLIGFTQERTNEVSIPGTEDLLHQFQAQAFVLPHSQGGMAVITVTTFDPEREDEARKTAAPSPILSWSSLPTRSGDHER